MQIKLSTHGFDLEDVEFLCSLLCKRYNEYFGITIENGRGMIYGSDSACRAFLQEINSIFLEFGLERKAYWLKEEARFLSNQPSKTNPKLGMSKRKSSNGKRNEYGA